MLWTKSCPRCQGDVFLDHDEYGYYKHCLQCGNVHDLQKSEAQGLARGDTPILREKVTA